MQITEKIKELAEHIDMCLTIKVLAETGLNRKYGSSSPAQYFEYAKAVDNFDKHISACLSEKEELENGINGNNG